MTANLYRIHIRIGLLEEIYTTDDERIISFEAAKSFGDGIRKIYKEYGYTLIEVPCITPEERVQFIKRRI